MSVSAISHKDFWQAVGFAAMASLCLAGSAAFGRGMGSFMPLPLIIAIRFSVPVLLLSIYAVVTNKFTYYWEFSRLDVYRGCCVVGSQYALFYVLTHTNIMLATLLYATSGIFLPVMTFLIYRVKIPAKTLVAIIISFCGVCISLNVFKNHLSYFDLIGLFSGLLAACSSLIQHTNSKRSRQSLNIFSMYFIASIISLLVLCIAYFVHDSIVVTKPVGISLMVIILCFSVLSIGNQMFKSLGFMKVNKAASLSPFFYLVIPLSGMIDLLVFHIKPSVHMWIGTVIILLGASVMSIRSNKRKSSGFDSKR